MAEEAVTEETTDVVESEEGQETEQPDADALDPKTLSWVISEGGVDREVTLDELLKGNMRQADYTRKTQAAAAAVKEAEQALKIQRALQANPQATIAELARSYRVEALDTDDDYDDPAAVRVKELEARVAAFEQDKINDRVEREVNALVLKYGSDIDVAAVMQHAVQNQLPSLEVSFKDLFFEDFHSVAKTAVTKKQKDELKVKAKKIAAIVNNGGSAGGDTKEQVTIAKGAKHSFEDSYNLARQGKSVAPWSPN